MSQHVLQSGIVQNIKFELQKLNMRREELAQMYTEKHPELIAVEAQIADLHEDLKQQVDNAYRVEKVSLSEMKPGSRRSRPSWPRAGPGLGAGPRAPPGRDRPDDQ
jgi:hypothetical protein